MTSSSTEDFVSALKQAPKAPPPSQAVAIVGSYMQLLAQGAIKGTHVLDTASLPHPKLDIFHAATLLMSLSRDAAEKATLHTAARSLAYFQPDLGAPHATLDETRSDDTSWDSVVKSEMQSIDAVLPPVAAR